MIRTEAVFLAEIGVLPDEADVAPGISAADVRARAGAPALDADAELFPGFTVGAMRSLLRRPAMDPTGSRFIESVAYSSTAGEIGQMALYAREDPEERAPIVLYAHGGGFHGGNHFAAIRYLHPLAARGYVAATMTYRMQDEALWPAALEDAKCAVRWLRHHATEIGGDPDRIVFVGDSAGAALAVLTALTPGRDEGDGGWREASSDVQGCVLLYPPADLPSTAAQGEKHGSTRLYDYMGARLHTDSPLQHVHAGCPPVLTMTGSADVLTPLDDINRFHQALDEVGVPNRLEVFPDQPHTFDWHPHYYEKCLELLLEFVTTSLGHVERPEARKAT